MARKGRIQKCGQCAKVLYIPSGLYRNAQLNTRATRARAASPSLWWTVTDRVGAGLSRFQRSKARLPIALLIVLLSVAAVFGINVLTHPAPPVDNTPSPLASYYKNVLGIDKQLKQAEIDFNMGAGGAPEAADYSDRISSNNSARFVRVSNLMLTQVQNMLTTVYDMKDAVPAGAESQYAKLTTKLEENQRFYARLKDAVNNKDEGRWKEAFTNLPTLRTATTQEEEALNNLQALVLKPTQTTPQP